MAKEENVVFFGSKCKLLFSSRTQSLFKSLLRKTYPVLCKAIAFSKKEFRSNEFLALREGQELELVSFFFKERLKYWGKAFFDS